MNCHHFFKFTVFSISILFSRFFVIYSLCGNPVIIIYVRNNHGYRAPVVDPFKICSKFGILYNIYDDSLDYQILN